MAKDDEILMGDPVALTKDSDSDGDGVGDMQERLEGTDPRDASDHRVPDPKLNPGAGDPRGDLDPSTLEREVGFDPTAVMPEGMSVESGLAGLKNIDGSDLSTGTNRYGIGEDDILDGRLGANSPRDVQRDPLASAKGTESGSGPPPGADLGSRAPNWDLVGADPEEFEIPAELNTPAPPIPFPPDAPPEEERIPPPAPPPGDEPIPEPKPPDPGPLRTDPDSDTGGGGGALKAVAEPRVVEGAGGGPQIEGDAPPVPFDLLHDPGDESTDVDTTSGAPRGRPDDPVVHTVNPDSGIVRPPPGGPPPGGGGGGDVGLFGDSDPATAAPADAGGAPGISLAGSGDGGGIQSVAPSAQSPDAISGLRDPSIKPVSTVEIGDARRAPDAGTIAVDKFAIEYLEDASLDAAAPDLAAAGLASDLGGDPAAHVNEYESPVLEDPAAESHDEFDTVDRDDGFDG